jgi:hypothetical protein
VLHDTVIGALAANFVALAFNVRAIGSACDRSARCRATILPG